MTRNTAAPAMPTPAHCAALNDAVPPTSALATPIAGPQRNSAAATGSSQRTRRVVSPATTPPGTITTTNSSRMNDVPLQEKELDPSAARDTSAIRPRATAPSTAPATSAASSPAPILVPTPVVAAMAAEATGSGTVPEGSARRGVSAETAVGAPQRAGPARGVGHQRRQLRAVGDGEGDVGAAAAGGWPSVGL